MRICVVGSGPAGASLAYSYYEHGGGGEILLFESRNKPASCCAGGLGLFALSKLRRLSPDIFTLIMETAESFIDTLVIGGERKKEYIFYEIGKNTGLDSLGVVINRERFDNQLVKLAIEKGASFIPRTFVKNLHAYSVETANDRITCDIVVDARGLYAHKPGDNIMLLYQAWLKINVKTEDKILLLASTHLRNGYYWVFPFMYGLKIGYGGLYRRKEYRHVIEKGRMFNVLREPLATYFDVTLSPKNSEVEQNIVRECSVALDPDFKITLYRDGVFRIGSAAGLIDRLTGAGIAYAIISGYTLGRLLAKHKNRSVTKLLYALNREMISMRLELWFESKLAEKIYSEISKASTCDLSKLDALLKDLANALEKILRKKAKKYSSLIKLLT